MTLPLVVRAGRAVGVVIERIVAEAAIDLEAERGCRIAGREAGDGVVGRRAAEVRQDRLALVDVVREDVRRGGAVVLVVPLDRRRGGGRVSGDRIGVELPVKRR